MSKKNKITITRYLILLFFQINYDSNQLTATYQTLKYSTKNEMLIVNAHAQKNAPTHLINFNFPVANASSTAVVLTLEVIIHKIVEVSVIALYIKYSTIGFIAATRLPT